MNSELLPINCFIHLRTYTEDYVSFILTFVFCFPFTSNPTETNFNYDAIYKTCMNVEEWVEASLLTQLEIVESICFTCITTMILLLFKCNRLATHAKCYTGFSQNSILPYH